MSDEERPEKLFTLTEAEKTRLEVEPILLEAMKCHRKLEELDRDLSQISNRIMIMGGLLVPYDKAVQLRLEHNQLAESVETALERIESTGCVVKDIDTGLLDFPARLNDEDVYLCWRPGEDRIRFWHRPDEGFTGRKPIDPCDAGSKHSIQ